MHGRHTKGSPYCLRVLTNESHMARASYPVTASKVVVIVQMAQIPSLRSHLPAFTSKCSRTRSFPNPLLKTLPGIQRRHRDPPRGLRPLLFPHPWRARPCLCSLTFPPGTGSQDGVGPCDVRLHHGKRSLRAGYAETKRASAVTLSCRKRVPLPRELKPPSDTGFALKEINEVARAPPTPPFFAAARKTPSRVFHPSQFSPWWFCTTTRTSPTGRRWFSRSTFL